MKSVLRTDQAAPPAAAQRHRLPDGRWHPAEIVFWLAPVAVFFLLPDYLILGSQILITGLFALSLDLILGYAGIVSRSATRPSSGWAPIRRACLARTAGVSRFPGLLAAGAVAGLAGWLCSFLVVRGGDLTRLMVTLGIGLMLFEAANKAAFLTGGVDGLSGVTMGKVLGLFEFDLFGKTAYI